jgi:hypothetical protein
MMLLCAAIDELDVIEGAGAGTLARLTTAGAVTNHSTTAHANSKKSSLGKSNSNK